MTGKISRRVLVVDDDATTRFLCKEVLSAAGLHVDAAQGGMEALCLLSEREYDLVVTDVNMPDIDGIGLYVEAAARSPRLKDRFIFMTASLSSDVWPKLKGFGVKCIFKPFRINEFLALVDASLLDTVEQARPGQDEVKRQDKRFTLSEQCEVYEKSSGGKRVLTARISDISSNGLKILYAGAPLKASTPVSVYTCINLELLRNATVVWSREVNGYESASGLSFTKLMPVTSIVALRPGGDLALAAV